MRKLGLRTGLLGGTAGLLCATWAAGAMAENGSPPDFSSQQAGWIALQLDFFEVPGVRPGPIRADPAHPYFQNGAGVQPTFRISDLSNPNLKPWVKEQMKKGNADVLAGKIAYTPRSSCEPSGVPSYSATAVSSRSTFFRPPRS